MYVDQESIFYYLTVMNEQYAMPEMPKGARDGILKGMYKFRAASKPKAPLRAQLFGSGAILPEVIKAQEILESKYDVVGRRLERDQLHRALSRRPRGGALEHAAPGRHAARAVRRRSA